METKIWIKYDIVVPAAVIHLKEWYTIRNYLSWHEIKLRFALLIQHNFIYSGISLELFETETAFSNSYLTLIGTTLLLTNSLIPDKLYSKILLATILRQFLNVTSVTEYQILCNQIIFIDNTVPMPYLKVRITDPSFPPSPGITEQQEKTIRRFLWKFLP